MKKFKKRLTLKCYNKEYSVTSFLLKSDTTRRETARAGSETVYIKESWLNFFRIPPIKLTAFMFGYVLGYSRTHVTFNAQDALKFGILGYDW